MIERTRMYEYEPRSIARDKARRRSARARRFILRAVVIALIALAVFVAIESLPALACTPYTVPACIIGEPPYMAESHKIFIPIAAR